jgi:hypothetical protein
MNRAFFVEMVLSISVLTAVMSAVLVLVLPPWVHLFRSVRTHSADVRNCAIFWHLAGMDESDSICSVRHVAVGAQPLREAAKFFSV